jgi:aminopeptidase S
MNQKILTFLVLLACATRALADSTIGSVSVGSQSPGTVLPGSNASYTITVARTGSGSVDVNLTITNLPAGVTATFVPSQVSFTGSQPLTKTASLTLATTASVAPGTYNFSVTGRDGHSHNFKTSNGALVVGSDSSKTLSQPATLALERLPQLSAQLTCTGSPGYSYQIQATADLGNPSWTSIGTATADQTGVCVFVDANASLYSQRFYRALTTN